MYSTVVFCAVAFAILGNGSAAIYVAPNGDDQNTGTLESPFATLHRARDEVRHLAYKGLDGDLTVLIRGGAYFLDAPLVFGVPDSGTDKNSITFAAYPGEDVLVSGGRRITGWEKGAGDKWTVTLPAAQSGEWRFRQLFVDGQRLPRGRFPNGDGLLRVVQVNDDVTRITLDTSPGVADLGGKDAELVVYQNWSVTRARIVSSDGATVQTSHPAGWMGHGDATTTSPGKPCYLENAPEFVDVPGEWYLHYKTGVLTYQAAEGEDPNTREFIAPHVEKLLIVRGTPETPVRNVHFSGLTFAHTEWRLPEFGYQGIQAGHHGTSMIEPAHVLPLALEFAFAEECRIEHCRIEHAGACGIGFAAGCRDNVAERCTLEDIGGNGIMVGWRGDELRERADLAGDASLDADWRDPRFVPRNNTITQCTLQRCGAVNLGCVGIFDAFCDGTQIIKNRVSDMPYTGISIGFRWNETETSQRNCSVISNDVFDVMKMLADGGAIYTLGYQPGTVLRGNVLHDVHRSAFAHGGAPNNGIFFDQGSKGYLVEGNSIYNTSGEPIRFNQTGPENLTVNDNYFGVSPGNAAYPADAARQAGPSPE